ERCEAAIGVCRIDAKGLEQYNSPLAVALVGRVLVDFSDAYINDYTNISTKKITELPWRVYAERLEKALTDFTKNAPKETDAQRKALEQLNQLIAKTDFNKIKELKSIAPPQDLRAVVDGISPTSGLVFEGVPSTNLNAKGGKGGKEG